jgi:hypothetical protein
MALDGAYSKIRRHLEAWGGYPALAGALQSFDDLQVYVAGGAVRNVLMGLASSPKDFDFLLRGGSVTAAIRYFESQGQVQHTPYGAPRWHPAADEERYADLMPIARFVPGLWPCEDIIDVLNQFDFTANAVAYDLRTGRAFDPQNGARDALRRVMRMVRFDYPDGPYVGGASLNRNAVLWFRIVHYTSVLGLSVEPLTRAWLVANRHFREQADEFGSLFFPPDLRLIGDLHG